MDENDIKNIIRSIYDYYKHQMIIDCSYSTGSCSKVIRSHTIQNGTIIDQLAIGGHVTMISPKNGTIVLDEDVSRNQASTFTGLCSAHDNQIFSPIDLGPKDLFDINNPELLSLIAFRGLLKEYFEKSGVIKTFEIFLKLLNERNTKELETMIPYLKKFKGDIPFDYIDVDVLFMSLVGNYIGLMDLEPLYQTLKKSIDTKDFSQIEHDVLSFDYDIKWAASSVCTPNTFFDNSKTLNNFKRSESESIQINSYMAKVLGGSAKQVAEKSKINNWKLLCINIFPNLGKTFVVFSYLKKDTEFSKFKDFLQKLKDLDEVERYLTRFLVGNVGNIVFSRDFFKGERESEKEALLFEFKKSIENDNGYHNFKFNIFK